MDRRSPEVKSGLLSEGRFGKYFLLVLFVITFIAFLNVIQIFIVNAVIAAVFASIFYPFYKSVLKALWNQKSISAFVCCVVIFLGLLIPLTLILQLVTSQAVELYQTAEPKIVEVLKKGDEGILGKLKTYPFVQQLPIETIDLRSAVNEGAKYLGVTTAKIVNKTSLATVGIIMNLIVLFITLFFFFRDGEAIVEKVKGYIPLEEKHKEIIVTRFASMSRAVIKGTLIVGLIQSSCGALTLLVFGIDTWALWGVVMLVTAVIPFVGTGSILIPAGIIMIIAGEVWQGISIILISALFISSIDNVLRPKFIGKDVGMHYLLIFFSILGGIYVFGIPGFIIGPLITAMFLTTLEIYRTEFSEHIEYNKHKKEGQAS